MSPATIPICIDLSWLKQARLLRPQINELTIHSHIKSMGLLADNLMPSQATPALNSDSIKAFLLTKPIIISSDKSKRLQVISGMYELHLARHFLEPSDRIPAMVVNSATNEQINQLLLSELLILPLILKQNLHIEKVWKYIIKLENLGILQENNPRKISKTKWALWLGCDVRKLHD